MQPSSVPDPVRIRVHGIALAALGITFQFLAPACDALAVSVDDATFTNGVFRVAFTGVLDAPPSGVEAVLLDYTRYHVIDPRIRSARLVARDPNGAWRVRTIIDACAGIFCRRVTRVERVTHAPGRLFSTVIPEESDMRRGMAHTYWRAQGAGTRVQYDAEFQPDFWVPALIGRTLAIRALQESTLQLFRNVEHEANAR